MAKVNIKAYSFFLFMIFLVSMELWIGWGRRGSVMLTIFGALALIAKVINKVPWDLSRRNVLLCTAFYAGYYLVHPQFELREFFTQIPPQLIPICCIVFLRDELKESVLHDITKWFAALMIISIPIYFITNVVQLPSFGTLIYGEGDTRYGAFENYLFYVKEDYFTEGVLRFGGPFLEPGYLGMIGAFLLFVNQYDFKNKSVIVILFSVLLSFSLAGWALAFLGYVGIQLYKGRINFKWVLAFVLVMGIFILFGINYNGGDNLIYNEILSRLVFDEEKGFAGNNRNVVTITVMFLEMWGDTNLLLHGYPESAFAGLAEWETMGAGLDKFVVFHGLLGILYVFLFYILSLFYAKDKKYAWLFFILILLCFWQRTYALWFSWIICFHYTIIVQDRKKLSY